MGISVRIIGRSVIKRYDVIIIGNTPGSSHVVKLIDNSRIFSFVSAGKYFIIGGIGLTFGPENPVTTKIRLTFRGTGGPDQRYFISTGVHFEQSWGLRRLWNLEIRKARRF